MILIRNCEVLLTTNSTNLNECIENFSKRIGKFSEFDYILDAIPLYKDNIIIGCEILGVDYLYGWRKRFDEFQMEGIKLFAEKWAISISDDDITCGSSNIKLSR